MAKKIAIVISGAVSLGSYEAGVMFEIINALAHHNQFHSEDQIKIDAIVGASAGAMTAAVLTHRLLFEPDGLAQKDTNALYQVWVKKTRIEDLLKESPGDDPRNSILSSSYIAQLGKDFLPPPTGPGAPHSAAAARIQLGFAMTNLNGLDYGVKTLSGNDFIYTHFEDCMIRTIDSTCPQATDWGEIREAAIASGSFPFAFAEREIVRHASDPSIKSLNLRDDFSQ
ncbi:MAG: patatin-like phospholipase family protein [Chthoniobacteraceae bacterium]